MSLDTDLYTRVPASCCPQHRPSPWTLPVVLNIGLLPGLFLGSSETDVMSLVLVLSPNTERPRPTHWPLSLDPMLLQQWPNPDYCYLEPVIGVKPKQLHQMAVSTDPSLGGYVIQLASHFSDTENYWGFQGYSPFHIIRSFANKSIW